MSSRSLIVLALVALSCGALGAACDAQTKCQPACAEPGIAGSSGGGAGGAAGRGDGSALGGAGDGGGASALGGAGGATIACTPPASTICAQPAPSFAAGSSPVVDRSCNTCHADDNPDGIWPLHAWADVAAWQQLIISDLVNCTMPPPDSGTPFSESERQQLFAWLACNSPDN